MDATLIGSLIWVLIGTVACNRMAKSQGRNMIIWTVLGFIFSWIAIIALYFRGDSDEVALRKVEEEARRR